MTQAQTDSNESAKKLMATKAQASSSPTNAPAVKPANALAIPEDVAASNWGAIETMETTDLLFPKIYHQQAMSKFVADGNARPGDFCDSLTGALLAKKEDKLSVIIFGAFKTMVISKQQNGQFVLDKIVTILPENAREFASKPLTEEIAGVTYKNNLQYNFYCLIAGKEAELPYVLSLGSTKTKAAKKLNTMLYKLSALKLPGASVVFDLSSTTEKNDKGSWAGLEITQGRDATQAELLRAHAWYLKSKSQKFVVVEEEASADAIDDDDSIPF